MSCQLVLKCTGVTLTFSENELKTLIHVQTFVKNILTLCVCCFNVVYMVMCDAKKFTYWF